MGWHRRQNLALFFRAQGQEDSHGMIGIATRSRGYKLPIAKRLTIQTHEIVGRFILLPHFFSPLSTILRQQFPWGVGQKLSLVKVRRSFGLLRSRSNCSGVRWMRHSSTPSNFAYSHAALITQDKARL